MIHDPLAHAECLQFIRAAIAQNDPQTARDIASVLAEVCVNGHASREAIWRDLSEAEREQFRLLLTREPQSQPQAIAQPLSESSERNEDKGLPICLRSAPPIALADNSQAPESPQPTPEPELIAPADAEKLRDIATVWWPEYYPEQVQSLIAQMYAWGAPGVKYDPATITAWLAGEDAVTRERIGELMRRR